MRPVCPTQGSTTDVAARFSFQARQRSGSLFRGCGLKAVQGRRTGAAARFFFSRMGGSGWNKAGILLLGLTGLLMTGCAWTGSDGAQRTLILGFGVVTHTNDTGMAAQHTRVLGAMWGPYGGGAGLIQQHRVEIDPGRATNDLLSLRVTPLAFTFTHERATNSPATNP